MTSSKDTASCSSGICTQKGGWCRRLILWKGAFRLCSSLRPARVEQRAFFFLSSWLIPLFPLSTHYARLSSRKRYFSSSATALARRSQFDTGDIGIGPQRRYEASLEKIVAYEREMLGGACCSGAVALTTTNSAVSSLSNFSPSLFLPFPLASLRRFDS
jgi:hypothetical protein